MKNTMPKISICIPIHKDMKNGAFFLWRALTSIAEQTFKDYEIVITDQGTMPVNSNRAIKQARGRIIKMLYMDDWLAHPKVLEDISVVFDEFPTDWFIQGSSTNPIPKLTKNLETGDNKLGSPSALTFLNRFEDNLLFDENLSWLLDCDLYKRLLNKFGTPGMQDGVHIGIGVHDGQMTNLMSEDYKLSEHEYVRKKYEQESITNRS